MRVQNAKHYFSKFPTIIYSNDRISVLIPTIHDGSSNVLKMLAENLSVLNDILSIFDMKNSTIVSCEFFDDPGDLSGSNPGVGIVEFL